MLCALGTLLEPAVLRKEGNRMAELEFSGFTTKSQRTRRPFSGWDLEEGLWVVFVSLG